MIVSEKEYEEIKNRVCKIEKELSIELENAKPKSLCEVNIGFNNTVNIIQSVYEQTLVQSEPLSPTTDHLAKRLSRELRIRTSEQKIIRSPSARKIGNMKRRFREPDRPNNKIFKSSSFQSTNIKSPNIEKMNHSSPSNDDIKLREKNMSEFLINEHIKRTATYCENRKLPNTLYQLNGRLSVNSLDQSKINGVSTKTLCSNVTISSSKFRSKSMDFFENKDILCKKKCTNVFTEHLSSNLFLSSNHLNKSSVNIYNNDAFNVKFSRSKDRISKSNIPSIKRGINLKQKRKNEKLYSHIKQMSTNSKENVITFRKDNLNPHVNQIKYLGDKCSSKNVPHIKKSLIVTSPQRIYKTPSAVKNTPLKMLSASQCFNTNISF